ncbi:unnamed protein product [Sphenostylis stenocarpa]|uniref:Endonuclease/exonuclease/phosphatase domain-containing protein n=1 Tax=Sphenostylis stenocarpa TaxID=92480 RepID=A0AA86TLL4_9FABA|nr:unnamed protein product [Sphenostylis stenocarpa]
MRRTHPSIHFLAATDTRAATATATSLSSRQPHRGRGRGFSGGRGHAVSGDAHLGSVRDANLGLLRGESESFANQTPYHQSPSYSSRPHPPPPHHRQPQFRPPPPQFRLPPPPPFRQPPPPQFRQPPPPQFPQHPPLQFRQNPPPEYRPAFRRPKHLRERPPDYRDWELVLTPPPPPHGNLTLVLCDGDLGFYLRIKKTNQNAIKEQFQMSSLVNGSCFACNFTTERFKVLSYNILADYLALDHRNKLYFHIPPYILDWHRRKRSILFELGLWSADILCLQEVDRFHELAEELKPKGYSGIWKVGNPVDGCAIFWQKSRFNFLYEECIEFNKMGLRDNVAQLCVLEEQEQRPVVVRNHQAQPQYWQAVRSRVGLKQSMSGSRKVVVCNIHVLYNPNRGEIKLGQVRVLLEKAKALSKLWNNAPIVICGDFNCTPKSPLYNFISEQKIDLSGIDRNKVSGQDSAIRASKPYYGPKASEISASGSVQATFTGGVKEVVEQNTYQSDRTDLDTKCHHLDNKGTHPLLDMSIKSCSNLEFGKENDAFAGKDTDETAVDHSKIFCEDRSIKEPDPSYREGRSHISPVNNAIHDITPVTSSAPEAVNSEKTGKGSNEHISDAVPISNKELSKKSNFHVPEGNKQVESTDLDIVEISPTKPSSQTSVSNAFEVPRIEYGDNPSHEEIADDQNNSSSTAYLVGKSHRLSNINFPPLDEKEKSFFDEIDETITNSENIGDDSSFVSSLHNAEGVGLDIGSSMKSDLDKSYQYDELNSASNLLLPVESNEGEDDLSPNQISKSICTEEATYNPALWTPMEIETATGNADCTFLEHPLLLRSTYTEAMDCSGTRDHHGEPLVTSYNRRFSGTVDYIW